MYLEMHVVALFRQRSALMIANTHVLEGKYWLLTFIIDVVGRSKAIGLLATYLNAAIVAYHGILFVYLGGS